MKRVCLALIPSHLLLVGSLFISFKAIAQVTSDGTLSTTVTSPDEQNFTIEGGNRPNGGGNLFHSFRDFSVPTNGSAVFNNGPDIANIISRVTGGNLSSIDGLIKANGSANLYLINPAGILFGQNARLDIGGSFFGSTADSLLFPEGEFSAVNPDAPPLLTINIPIGLKFRDNPGNIVNQSTTLNANGLGLSVNPGETISLIGGNVSVENGGIIFAPGGKIELGGLVETGIIDIIENGSFSFPENIERGNISVINDSILFVASGGGGSIGVNAKNFNLNNSLLSGGIRSGQGSVDAQAGDITINASESVVINGGRISTSSEGQGDAGDIIINARGSVSLDGQESRSEITSNVNSGAIGNGGNINIITSSLNLGDRVSINAGTSGQGNGGNITVDASDSLSLASQGNITDISSSTISDAVGNAGDITINTRLLTLTNRAYFDVSAFGGQGNAGNVTLNASEAANFDRQDTDGANGIFANVYRGSTGNGGKIEINTGSLTLDNGVRFFTSNFGQGNGGNITINARDTVSLNLNSQKTGFFNVTGLFANIGSSTSGNAGSIEINTGSLIINNEAELSARKFGEGKGGNITINATDNIFLNNDSDINVTGSEGGSINIKAQSLTLENGGSLINNTSGIGNGGNIAVFANENISLANDSDIINGLSSASVGQGGQINLTAKSVSLSGMSSIATPNRSENEQSKGGSIEINVSESLDLIGGSFINSVTDGKGDAGNVTINGEGATILIQGRGSIENSFSSILSTSNATGNAGDIKISGRSLSLEDGGALGSNLGVDTLAQGLPGNITINIEEAFTLSNNGTIASFVGKNAIVPEGENSTIQINAGSLFIGEDSSISSFNSGIGNAGDIVINVDKSFDVVGGFILSSLFSEGEGKAGNINITSRSLSLRDGAFFNSNTGGQGDSGIISISTDEAVTLSGADTFISNIVEAGGVGNSQGIFIAAESLSINEGAQIQTLVRGASENNPAGIGNGGNIDINTNDAVDIVDGSIRSSLGRGAKGNAGNINITARSLSLENSAVLNSSTLGRGDSGIISIATDETISLSGAGTTIFNNVERGGVGNSQGISIEAEFLSVTDGAQIQTLVRRASEDNPAGVGNAGDININVRDTVNFSGFGINSEGRTLSSQANSALEARAEGKAGNIKIKARSFSLENGAGLSTSSFGRGSAGNITLDIQDIANLSGFSLNSNGIIVSSQISSSLGIEAEGTAGNIEIKARSFFLENGASLNTSSFGQGSAGDITLDIQDTVSISGFVLNDSTNVLLSQVSSELATGAKGKAGNIEIEARSLLLEDGGRINNTTSGLGDAGNININVDESIELFRSSTISNSVGQGGVGKGGDLDIQAKSLTLREGSQINAVVFREGFNALGGTGTGGNITITATDFIDIAGVSTVQFNIPDPSGDPSNTTGLLPTAGFSSGILAATQRGATGDGGSITVTTDAFRIADGAVIDNSTTNDSKAGDITVNANTFEAIGGGQIITATRGNGKAADIKLNIADNIFISGSDPNFEARLARANEFGAIQGGDNIVTNQGAASGIFANTSADSTGDGGNIFIGIFKSEGKNLVLDTNRFTREITLANGAKIAADSQGEGSGGAIFVQAGDFTLDNQAEILAETTARQDDNTALSEINLGVADILKLKNDSTISTQALSNADGGNINIDAKFIIAFPSQDEGSDILTRAAQAGAGGDINITTEALFGIEERAATTNNATNDIDASSQFGLSGRISITRPDVNPTSGLLDLTEEVVNASDLIAQNVCTQTANSEFVDIGKGGLPQNPEYTLVEDATEVGLVEPVTTSEQKKETVSERVEVKPKKTRKPPAQGWIWHENGIVELVAYNPHQTGEQRNSRNNYKGCK